MAMYPVQQDKNKRIESIFCTFEAPELFQARAASRSAQVQDAVPTQRERNAHCKPQHPAHQGASWQSQELNRKHGEATDGFAARSLLHERGSAQQSPGANDYANGAQCNEKRAQDS
jgi:hypothetical protein